MTEHVENNRSALDYLAEQFVILHVHVSQSSTDRDGAHVCSDDGSPHVHFDEYVFNVDRSNALEAHFDSGFNDAPHDV